MGVDPEPEAGWVRAVLEMAVLAALTEGDQHGYALAQRLAGQGLGKVRGGVLYPVLNRMEIDAVVESSWHAGQGGPGRKVYAITASGRHRLSGQRVAWGRFADSLTRYLEQTAEAT
ncbi:PadR family transcriptional regulator [Actinoplanes lobatus]|uniref:PadR family transcriptional regulator n=1 Tax=Actinoplanes lobatus TaxID=113568 RepID=A0A7W7HFW6_9ACTN|nr:PadR family transcriptional regulator [Actinoplanes lobatus]MBB4749799.1 PadR family transcriptional regulator PadR [Actinoplanes lobatus]GGN76331.1 PadR family transcriptional regulator [Actinoplanes lobatus]GIE38534.1 PadR family transcriptional regulator [Actinoplanes lobatus]